MQNSGETIALLNPDLTVRRLEVVASPMLDLVELRSQHGDGAVRTEYLDHMEAAKLLSNLRHAVGDLARAREELAARVDDAPLSADQRWVVDFLTGEGKFVIKDQRAGGGVLRHRFRDFEDARVCADRLNRGGVAAIA